MTVENRDTHRVDLDALRALLEKTTEEADREDFSCPRCNYLMLYDGQDARGLCNGCAQELCRDVLPALVEECWRHRNPPCPAAQRGEPDKGFCTLTRLHDGPHRHADGSEWERR